MKYPFRGLVPLNFIQQRMLWVDSVRSSSGFGSVAFRQVREFARTRTSF